MKNLRRLLTAVVLTLALALPASAGYISTGKADPPPAPIAAAASEIGAAAGEPPTGGGETSAPFAEALLTLSELVLSLF